ncbi:PGAP1-like alpha/beta domain-containing protein [Iodobacter ciconiae]|uniref:GPI inositol-deacylase PGAP1-like alpha/beta domain-containing protein n=1 Tax=Iodobacter ciconiae TaxID=2496266 RepID=A0A3S8ZPA2_9NEIS|nr:hypothetical protein [Iodobacter ciconiae]AZN35281.1 hypothetical protein EJO50_01515 [Iodobacter ciconiae]
MTNQAVDSKAVRRLPLQFDDKGEPMFSSVKSPEDFKLSALVIRPPHTVIPIIFVPGIMGTNIRMAEEKKDAWAPPNSALSGLGQALKRSVQKPEQRQVQFDPNNTEVNPDGPCSIPGNFFMLTEKEAKKRGWGALHADSYHETLQQLEISLNEQYSKPGRSKEDGNHLLEEIGLLTQLGAADSSSTDKPDYKKAAAKAAAAWGETPPALSPAEVDKLDDYYYPVWACGYNWLQSNKVSGEHLLKRINEVIKFYNDSQYFECSKVILLTHSMGGFVARSAAQQDPSKILGIVHGVQPVGGAPVVYRRFRAGTEVDGFFDIAGAAAAAIIGWSAADVTPALSCAPGPLELLPNTAYPKGWLKIIQKTGGEERIIKQLPESDPYEEIYSKTTDDCWWGMVDPSLIDPANTIKSVMPPLKAYKVALNMAEQFHANLELSAHEKTYGYYGIDNNKFLTFGSVSWDTKNKISTENESALFVAKDQWRNTTGKADVALDAENTLHFKLRNERDQGGDGTVPLVSGAALEKLIPAPQMVFKMKGFDHQNSYKNRFAMQSTIYSIAKLVQLAEPATP